MKLVIGTILLLTAFSCGKEKKQGADNPTTCFVERVSEGVKFTCVDKNGVESSGVVLDGKDGPKGEHGEAGKDGKDGKDGRSLEPVSNVVCHGSIPGWMENSSYEITFISSIFETEDRFLRNSLVLKRGDDIVGTRDASAFVLSTNPQTKISDGLLTYSLDGLVLSVTSFGEIDEKIECEVKQ